MKTNSLLYFAKNFVTLFVFIAIGCGVDFEVGDGNPANLLYGGIGSFWTYEKNIKDKTFEIHYSDTLASPEKASVSGRWETQSSGFTKLFIERGTGEMKNLNARPEPIVAYGIEVPGSIFVLKVPEEEKLIFMPVLGKCPTQNITSNALVTRSGKLHYNANDRIHGIVKLTPEDRVGEVESYLFGDQNQAKRKTQNFSYSCNDGEVTIENEDTYGVLAPSGIGILGGKSNVMLLPQVETFSIADLEGKFAGIIFLAEDQTDQRKSEAISLQFDALGVGTATILSSVDGEGQQQANSITVSVDDSKTSTAELAPGSFLYSLLGDATITDKGLGILMAVDNLNGSGKTFLAGFGQEPNSNTAYFLFAVEK